MSSKEEENHNNNFNMCFILLIIIAFGLLFYCINNKLKDSDMSIIPMGKPVSSTLFFGRR